MPPKQKQDDVGSYMQEPCEAIKLTDQMKQTEEVGPHEKRVAHTKALEMSSCLFD